MMKNSPSRRQFHAFRPILETLEDRTLLSTVVGGDFNGDGFADLAFARPDADVGGRTDAGAVIIRFGTASGLTNTSQQKFTQADLNQQTNPNKGDHFGSVLAAGDFNNDGYTDLAIGVPQDDLGGADGGVVHVLYGSPAGLTIVDNQLWSQDSPGIPHATSSGDLFGAALAAGDFNGDGFDDLCVGMPGNDLSNADEAGGIIVIHGSATGLTDAGSQTWDTRKPDIKSTTQAFEHFGSSLASGDFNGDGFDDVAVGVPDKDWSPIDAGIVILIYGTADGLSSAGNQLWSQSSAGIEDIPEEGDRFASALAAGDINGDGFDDLAVGVPFEDIGDLVDAGRVHVIYGSSAGLTATGDQLWSQNSEDIIGAAESGDHFGEALAFADFNGNGFDDLAVGVPAETIDQVAGGGVIHILYGSATGLVAAGNEFWSQNDFNFGGGIETNDHFGASLADADFNGDGFFDLAVAVPGEDLVGKPDPGAVNLLYGGPTGLVKQPPASATETGETSESGTNSRGNRSKAWMKITEDRSRQ